VSDVVVVLHNVCAARLARTMSAAASTRICVAPLLVAAASLAAAPLRGAGASGYCCSAVQVRHVPFYGGSICVYAQKSSGLPAPRVPSPFTHWRTRWAGAYSSGLVALQGGMRSTRRYRQHSRMRQPRGSRGANSSGSFHARQALQRAAVADRAALQLGVFFGGRVFGCVAAVTHGIACILRRW
jgi:hypothetical protein